jgi:flagellar hook-basal body complex protein FliE
MSPQQIVQWIQLAALVLQYGKEVVDRAVETYKKIE